MHTLLEKNVDLKISLIEESCHRALMGEILEIPLTPGRDVSVMSAGSLPSRGGLSRAEGQARLLYTLASIELQAMELALRSVIEYPNAPRSFREQMADLAISESRHLKACLDGIRKLGFNWGDFPTHLALWNAVSSEDSLLDRLLIVHRYLEGSGLDAGETFLRKLNGVQETHVIDPIVRMILTEEVGHVEFGSRWYRYFCKEQGLDSDHDFQKRYTDLKVRLPRRMEKISRERRLEAGFTNVEIDFLISERENTLRANGFTLNT